MGFFKKLVKGAADVGKFGLNLASSPARVGVGLLNGSKPIPKFGHMDTKLGGVLQKVSNVAGYAGLAVGGIVAAPLVGSGLAVGGSTLAAKGGGLFSKVTKLVGGSQKSGFAASLFSKGQQLLPRSSGAGSVQSVVPFPDPLPESVNDQPIVLTPEVKKIALIGGLVSVFLIVVSLFRSK